ncbi:MAG: asparagine synthase (glutamine-hydrolyzing) [Flavobacteriales bacterium]|nr:asparagine synthase (glutamine-hydrolyzing) [Flavobacteriales bacterium]
MCGIAGSITWRGDRAAALETFDIARLSYRGPDALVTTRSSTLPQPPTRVQWQLAHARLSILDLAANANQPMSTADGRYWMVFNGEIYNHHELRTELERLGHDFRTDHSDSETLLFACIQWGKGCLERLNGMFAFVFIDNVEGTLFAARDRVGIKPFYYHHTDGVLTFASEPKAMFASRRVNRAELAGYFNFFQVEGTATFFEGIQKLPAGHYFELAGDGRPEPVRYWHPLIATGTVRDLDDERSCMDLLEEAVALQMVADVEVGTYLSGGLDSSVVTALASKGRRVNTFSIGFDDSVPGYTSELAYARMVSDHLNTRHHPITIAPEAYLQAQQRVFRILDEPIANEACGPLLLLSEKARAEGVTVCLSGEGSDELFVGYRHWHDAHRVNNMLHHVPKVFWKAYLAMGAPVLKGRKPDWVSWMKRYTRGQHIIWGGNDALCQYEQSDVFNAAYLAEARDPYSTVSKHMDAAECRNGDLLQRLSAFDLQFRLPENLLARVDRMSMAASVEARVPYLDHRLVERSMRLKTGLLVGKEGEKLALKRFARGSLPASIIDRQKVGFTIPLHEVLNTKEALKQRELILAMDDVLRIYSVPFRKELAAGRVTGMRLWPHFALANWWSLHMAQR